MSMIRRLLMAVASAVLLAAAGCGGGGSDRARFEQWQAEGLWAGTTSSGTFDGVVLDTGEYWFIYGSGGVARSIVHGNGYFTRDLWRSDDGADYVFGFDRPFGSSLSSVVEPEFSIDGEIFLARRLEAFSVDFVPEYRRPANPAAIVGRRTGSGIDVADRRRLRHQHRRVRELHRRRGRELRVRRAGGTESQRPQRFRRHPLHAAELPVPLFRERRDGRDRGAPGHYRDHSGSGRCVLRGGSLAGGFHRGPVREPPELRPPAPRRGLMGPCREVRVKWGNKVGQ